MENRLGRQSPAETPTTTLYFTKYCCYNKCPVDKLIRLKYKLTRCNYKVENCTSTA